MPIPLPKTPPVQTNPPPGINIAKTIGEITKMYSEEQKYDGNNGSFNHKLSIFHDICERVGLLEDTLSKALPIILKGLV